MSENRIETLPQAVADRIAAGEVVDRPSSVIKELVENALDAGATKLSVVVEDAGRTLLKVVDDGSGMTGAELAAAIGRHATSKLRRFEDLERLNTYGFRGEALPSIASVSRMEIVSRAEGDDVGNVLKVDGGRVMACEPIAAAPGSSVSVRHLFFNVPARRKFLRSDATEFKWIMNIFRHFALSNPEAAWEFFKDGEPLFQLPTGDWRQRLAGLFGDDVGEEMLPIDYQRGWLRVKGWISPPSLTQRSNSDQFLFVNRRPIQNPRLNRAVYRAAEPYLVAGGHPLYMLMLEAEPDHFDINVHPAKKEVKFADEEGAFSAVWAGVRDAIAKSRVPVELKSPQEDGSPYPSPYPSPSKRHTSAQAGGGAPAPVEMQNHPASQRVNVESPPHLTPYVPVPRHHQAPGAGPMPFPPNRTDTTLAESAQSREAPRPSAGGEDGPVIWQAFDTYLISPLTTGLVVIDQHIAHERILYERALNAIDREPWTSQQLLFPVSFSVAPETVELLEQCIPLLRAMGFEIDRIAPREFRMHSVPSGVKISGERELILGIIEEYRDTASTGSDPRHRLASAFACRGAIKAGQPLELLEMQRLVDDLFRTEDPEFCPHGRPIYHVLSRREMDKWFKR